MPGDQCGDSQASDVSSTPLWLWISLGLALLVAISLIRLGRDGQDWGGDFSLYISHARNLSEGRPYADTGYIVNPYARSLSPATYPPLFPLLLAPLYGKFGLDFSMLKLPGILCFAATIPFLFCLFRRDLPAAQSMLAAGLWACWPFILWFKDSVLPDLVFTLLWVLALWMLRVAYDEPPARRAWPRSILIGIVCYAAYATRSAGIILPAAIVTYDLLRRRKVGGSALGIVATFCVLAICQNLMIHSDTSYLQMFVFAPFKTIKIYLYVVSSVFSTATAGWLRWVRYIATLPAFLLSCAGFTLNLRRFRSPTELAIAMYLVLLLLWSSGAGTRYIIPVIPFFFFYIVVALNALRSSVSPRFALWLGGIFMTSVLVCYVAEDRNFRPRRVEGGISTAGFAELCSYIGAGTKSTDVFIFQNPRVLSLYTRRQASVYPENGDPELVWSYIQKIHARYVIDTDFLEGDDAVLHPFIRKYADHLRLVFSELHFRMYRIE